ncbi:hypothetical protein [Desulfocurvibacter africanus]|nr:hypothetical protein [Desulfocurvibacter africanus]
MRLEQIAFETPAPALTAQVNCAYAYAAASHADAWLAEHFQKQNALN